MLCGMGLHEMPAVRPVKGCLHLIAFAEGICCFHDMNDLTVCKPGIKNPHTVDEASVTFLSATFRIENGSVKDNTILSHFHDMCIQCLGIRLNIINLLGDLIHNTRKLATLSFLDKRRQIIIPLMAKVFSFFSLHPPSSQPEVSGYGQLRMSVSGWSTLRLL